MKGFKVRVIAALASLSLLTGLASADETKQISVEQMTVSERYDFAGDIVSAILSNDTAELQKIAPYLTSDCYSKLLRSKVEFNGPVTRMICDKIEVNNSSDKDCVLMCNTMVINGAVNNAYLFELHIDANGKVYGYNIWVY